MNPSHTTILWTNRETVRAPKLVKHKKFKAETFKVDKASNSWYLNVLLITFFFIFLTFFLMNCKDGFFKTIDSEIPIPYSSDLVYKLQ